MQVNCGNEIALNFLFHLKQLESKLRDAANKSNSF